MKKYITGIFITLAALLASTSCSDGKSYAELLGEQDVYVNQFLCDHAVILEIPADTVFQYGPNAPYYKLTADGNLYMQVLEPGTKGNMAKLNDQVYFRYTRWGLKGYKGTLGTGEGNNTALSPCWFRYGNFQLESSYTWGTGIQVPLAYLPIDCKVNLIVKAEMGPSSEMSSVLPYLWALTYAIPE